jgi:hypothetical protein
MDQKESTPALKRCNGNFRPSPRAGELKARHVLNAPNHDDRGSQSCGCTKYAVPVALLTQPDGKVRIGGGFTPVNGVVRLQVARLYGDFFGPPLTPASLPSCLKHAKLNIFV